MSVEHYSVAFAVKSEKNKIPLWVLFIAVQFLDYIWATLVLLGIEKLRVIKGFTAGRMLEVKDEEKWKQPNGNMVPCLFSKCRFTRCNRTWRSSSHFNCFRHFVSDA